MCLGEVPITASHSRATSLSTTYSVSGSESVLPIGNLSPGLHLRTTKPQNVVLSYTLKPIQQDVAIDSACTALIRHRYMITNESRRRSANTRTKLVRDMHYERVNVRWHEPNQQLPRMDDDLVTALTTALVLAETDRFQLSVNSSSVLTRQSLQLCGH